MPRRIKSGVDSNFDLICRLVRPPSPVPLPAEELARFLEHVSASTQSAVHLPKFLSLMSNIGTWQACEG